jgi:hypothetical protein
VDGVEQITDASAVLGIGADLDLPPSGRPAAQLDVGYGVAFGAPVLSRSFSVAVDLVGANPVALRPFTIAQILTDFDANAAHLHGWVSDPFLGADGRTHVQTIAVSRDGTWALFEGAGPAASRSGTLTLDSWPDESLTATFTLAADLPAATISAPFQAFTLGSATFRAQ